MKSSKSSTSALPTRVHYREPTGVSFTAEQLKEIEKLIKSKIDSLQIRSFD